MSHVAAPRQRDVSGVDVPPAAMRDIFRLTVRRYGERSPATARTTDGARGGQVDLVSSVLHCCGVASRLLCEGMVLAQMVGQTKIHDTAPWWSVVSDVDTPQAAMREIASSRGYGD